jgi:hypothetical protein
MIIYHNDIWGSKFGFFYKGIRGSGIFSKLRVSNHEGSIYHGKFLVEMLLVSPYFEKYFLPAK